MAKQKVIKLKNAKLIFPNTFTRARSHDLISASAVNEKILLKREQKALQETASEIREGTLFGKNTDVMITRTGRKIIIKPF